jgi:hypothetical protein
VGDRRRVLHVHPADFVPDPVRLLLLAGSPHIRRGPRTLLPPPCSAASPNSLLPPRPVAANQ